MQQRRITARMHDELCTQKMHRGTIVSVYTSQLSLMRVRDLVGPADAPVALLVGVPHTDAAAAVAGSKAAGLDARPVQRKALGRVAVRVPRLLRQRPRFHRAFVGRSLQVRQLQAHVPHLFHESQARLDKGLNAIKQIPVHDIHITIESSGHLLHRIHNESHRKQISI